MIDKRQIRRAFNELFIHKPLWRVCNVFQNMTPEAVRKCVNPEDLETIHDEYDPTFAIEDVDKAENASL